ncbi:restriction endonuclease subunit S [Levilactobacillus lanxiensis]|uniref:Restriction endonuclease subunit S n=1 Tax=Levilactobacillus lanxiensis TaxID=2799568 RepID=A0ABW4D1S4_9LACO|nr:restriction endonuclease subunit S [Levilactobacillus lanxiensis]
MIDDKKRLVPRVRFRGFEGVWEQRRLNEVADRVTRKNSKLQTSRPLTISAGLGLVDQRDYFNKIVASKNLTNYILLLRGEFAYNKSYSKGYPFGTVKRLENYESGAVSTLYITFKSILADPQFLAQYYETSSWHREISKVAAEGARNHGLLNISPVDFMSTSFELPSNKDEQKRIGDTLFKLDNLIVASERRVNELKAVKNLVVEKIFSVKWRFKGFSDPWEQRKLGYIN